MRVAVELRAADADYKAGPFVSYSIAWHFTSYYTHSFGRRPSSSASSAQRLVLFRLFGLYELRLAKLPRLLLIWPWYSDF